MSTPTSTRRRRDALRRIDGPRGAPLVTLAVGGVSALAGALGDRPGAPLAALLAAGLVLCFFWVGALPLLLVGSDTSRAAIGLVVLLMTYALRLVAVFLVLALAAGTQALDVRWLALTLIACTLAWVGAQVALVGRSRVTL